MKKLTAKSLPKNLILIFLIFLTIAGFFSLIASPTQEEKEIPISLLVQEINQEKVEKIVVAGNDISITYKDIPNMKQSL